MIRRLTVDDASQLKDLRLLALKFDPLSFVSTFEMEIRFGTDYHHDKIRTNTKGEIFGIYGYFEENELIGTVYLSYEWLPKITHTANIYELYVKPDHRGKGIGSALLQMVITKAKSDAELEQLTLRANSKNTKAVNLYKKHGFILYGTRPNGIKEPDDSYQDELYFYLPLKT